MNRSTRNILTRAAAGLATALLVAGAIPVTPAPALAQGPPRICHPRAHLLAWLEEKYGETPVGFGVTNGALIEILASQDGMSWTIIQTSPGGISCMITSGEGWRTLPLPPQGPVA